MLKKSSLKELVLTLNVISAIATMLLFSFLGDGPVLYVPAVLLLVIGTVTIILNIVYVTSRPTKTSTKAGLIIAAFLVLLAMFFSLLSLIHISTT